MPPKPITIEMLHAMAPDQRKTLHKNALALDTEAARAVLALLATDDLMPRPKAAARAANPGAARKPRTSATKPKKEPVLKPIKAVYGRVS